MLNLSMELYYLFLLLNLLSCIKLCLNFRLKRLQFVNGVLFKRSAFFKIFKEQRLCIYLLLSLLQLRFDLFFFFKYLLIFKIFVVAGALQIG